MSTKELIEQAKIDIKNVVRLSLGVVPLDDAFSSFLSRLKVFFSSPPPELDESHAETRYRMAYMTREEWQEYERAVFDEACNKGVEE